MFADRFAEERAAAKQLQDLIDGPNDAIRDHERRWEINRYREACGMRPLSPIKRYGRAYKRRRHDVSPVPSVVWLDAQAQSATRPQAQGLQMIERVLVLDEYDNAKAPSFGFGDRVSIDGGDVFATVIGIAIHPHDIEFRVSWWNAGELREQWVAGWRLHKHEPGS